MKKELIINNTKYELQEKFEFIGCDGFGRLVYYNPEKDTYYKTIQVIDNVAAAIEHSVFSLYTICPLFDYEDEITEGEPDQETLFKVIVLQSKYMEANFQIYKKIN